MSDFGTYLKSARRAKGLSGEDLAELVGTTRNIITNLENDRRAVTVDQLLTISQALGVHPAELDPRLDADGGVAHAKLLALRADVLGAVDASFES